MTAVITNHIMKTTRTKHFSRSIIIVPRIYYMLFMILVSSCLMIRSQIKVATELILKEDSANGHDEDYITVIFDDRDNSTTKGNHNIDTTKNNNETLLTTQTTTSAAAIEMKKSDQKHQNDYGDQEFKSLSSSDESSSSNKIMMKCGNPFSDDQIPPLLFPLFEMVYKYDKSALWNQAGHLSFTGPMINGIKKIFFLQTCSYTLLDKFWDLTKEYNITRWSAHGGTLMGAMCYRSINPWDDDIDITVSSCQELDAIFDKGTNVTETYPSMATTQHTTQGWEGRLIDKDYILIRGPHTKPKGNWFKLKAVAQILAKPSRDLGGMDIQCFDKEEKHKRISFFERVPMQSSGFQGSCMYSL